ncbi:head-tail connector protein [Chromobacterium violaceum]|uniref:head-tail connector protein n=1 Tax=Chromobacterium violaceum TaxID=536 RepID=UPI00385D8997
MLTTLSNVKAWLNLPGAENDALLTRLIDAASAFIESWCGRRFAVQAYTEHRDGTGKDMLMFGAWPVTAVASVVIDGQPIPPAADFAASGYRFDELALVLQGYRFARGRRNVAISYTAGYAQIPADIEQACIDLVALRFKERDRIGHQSKSLAGETVTFYLGELSPAARAALAQYKKVVPI